ncbi:twin-arginine translocase subunit TatC [Akkermansiaceae bacterium]|nr:twin-arginine translocase subunit TatC [Akkermansiaceae bacterium]
MFILKKMFQLRDKVNPDAEKPFLDHLEDLRSTVTKIVITLLISTLVCFIYKEQLMDIMKRPVEQTWVTKQESKLPEDGSISLEQWEKALTYATVTPPIGLYSPEVEAKFWELEEDKELYQLTRVAVIYRVAREVPDEKQEDFLSAIPERDALLKERVIEILETKPITELNQEGNLRMMGAFKVTETFMLTMKLAFFAGIVISFPLLLYFLLQFILPGLKEEERKALWPALAIGFGLFLGGVFFSYFFVLPKVLNFFYDWSQSMGITNDWRIGYYISFATTFVLVFGLAFELPVVVMTLVHLGILSFTVMNSTRSYAVLAIVVIAALITPTPDIPTLMLLAGPMYILYEICIWLSYFYERKKKREEAEEEKNYMSKLLADPEIADDDHAETEEGEEEDFHDPHYDEDNYKDFPGEHQDPDDYDPMDGPDEDIPSEERDRK